MAGNWSRAPWELDDELHVYSGSQCVARTTRVMPGEQQVANAILIAAAPELYDALNASATLLQALSKPDDQIANAALRMAWGALSKARGDQPAGDPPIPNSATPQGA